MTIEHTIDVKNFGDREGSPSLTLADLQRVFVSIQKDLTRYIARRVGNTETAADLSQDLFEKLANIRADIPNPQKASSYLFSMARNIAIDHHRVEARRTEILSGSQVLFEDVGPSPEATAIFSDALGQIETALAELPPKCRKVLVLSRVHGYSHEEIANQLGVSVSLVEKYKLYALRHCRERMGQGG